MTLIRNKQVDFIPMQLTVSEYTAVKIKGIGAGIYIDGGVKLNNPTTIILPLGKNKLIVEYRSKCGCNLESSCTYIEVIAEAISHCHDEEANHCCEQKNIEYGYFLKKYSDGSEGYVTIKRFDLGHQGSPNFSGWYSYITNDTEVIPSGTTITPGIYQGNPEKTIVTTRNIVQGTIKLPQPFVTSANITSQNKVSLKSVLAYFPAPITQTVKLELQDFAGITLANSTFPAGTVGTRALTLSGTMVGNTEVASLIITSTQATDTVTVLITY